MLARTPTQRWMRPFLPVRVLLLVTLLLPVLSMDVRAVPALTDVGGPIISDTTWILANSPYIAVESVEVWEGVTLTIEPGVTVKFNSGKKLQVNGGLIARGTASKPITFTSNQANPAPGDWGNIEFTGTAITTTVDAEGNYMSGSVLQYCAVRYAGYANARGAIDARSLLIDHCTVQNNHAPGIYMMGTQTAPGRIMQGTISENSGYYGGGINTGYSIVSGNTINGNSASFGGGIYAGRSTVISNTIGGNSTNYGDGGGIYAHDSSISDNIVTGNLASPTYRGTIYGGGIYALRSEVTSNTVSNNRVSNSEMSDAYIKGGGIYAEDSTVSDNTVTGNLATTLYNPQATCYGRGGGIYAINSTVNTNTVIGNSTTGYQGHGGGIYASSSTVSGNTVSGNSATGSLGDGGGIYASGGMVSGNTVIANNASGPRGAGACVDSSDFLSNTVVGNSGPSGSTVGGLGISGNPQVHYNNFYGNEPYDVAVSSSYDISGTNNYWGTVSSVNILAQIYDWYDSSYRGRFLYIPYLQDPSPDAPFPPPTGLTADFHDNSANLSWDAHPSFTTGYGYKVYYDSDSSLPPYEGSGLNEGDSPIDVGNQTSYTLTGLDPSKDYYLTVTAYDNDGHESWYSNVEWRRGGYWTYLPVVLRNRFTH